jgi:anti-sigma B factor antagonist
VHRTRQVRPHDAGTSPAAPAAEALPTPFRVEVALQREAVHLRPVGELDMATVGRVRERLDELTAAGFKRVILDLRGATFLDSSGLRLVVDANECSAHDGWSLEIIAGPDAVQRPFDVAGLTARLPFVDAGSAGARSR